MMGGGGYGFGAPPPPVDPPDPMTQPLPKAAPATWPEREERVRWCYMNLTDGEAAKLYRLLRDRFRFKDYERIERLEAKSLAPMVKR